MSEDLNNTMVEACNLIQFKQKWIKLLSQFRFCSFMFHKISVLELERMTQNIS